MIRDDIEKTNKGKLEEINGQSNLLVSFGGVNQGLGMPVFEFFNSISDIHCDKIYLRDFQQAWYQKGVDSEIDNLDKVVEYLNNIISKNNYDKVCFLGNSMGGYAAILFGIILNVDSVISFAPQSFIDISNRLRNFDARWMKKISKIYFYKGKRSEYFDLKKHLSKCKPYKTEINVYYSPNHRLDRKHAERLKKQENIILHPISAGGHAVVKVVRNSGELKSLIKSAFKT